ncbi:Rossmann-like and DUF2520 domain-containing protein [Undibacterium sp. SXout7W]|uniref:Rossmann-like and DUF2520 domain-containing protein n=1 Tax=Undibacterium sp. SXout7W TaxID=3413049 RepID=UPI003BF266B3
MNVTNSMLLLNTIGAGKVGQVLARLLRQHQVWMPSQICNRSISSAQAAVDFIGAGQVVADRVQMDASDIWMLSVPDDQIVSAGDALTGKLNAHSIVFHCSGAKPSTILQSAIRAGAAVASVHPVRSFADVQQSAEQFAGTICSVEGDARALAVLIPALQAIGAKTVQISAESKLLYHAGSVFASNYLVSLIDIALHAYQAAGIPEDIALAMAAPLARQSLENALTMGTARALTGPIARGDMDTVHQQQRTVAQWNADAGDVYAAMMPPTIALAARKAALDSAG